MNNAKDAIERPNGAAQDVILGKTGDPLHVIAFAAGGLNSAMQLGLVHALLVSDAQPPDVVSGTSVGAVSATCLAEVMLAGAEQSNEETRRLSAVARFRQFFEEAQHLGDQLDRILQILGI